MGKVLSRAWYVVSRIFYLTVIWYVFSRLENRPETIIVPILGLLYAAIRGVGIGHASTTLKLAIALDGIQARVNSIADPEHRRDTEELSETRKVAASTQRQIDVENLFMALVWLLCLWQLFTALE